MSKRKDFEIFLYKNKLNTKIKDGYKHKIKYKN